jgi:hypothetical protein
MIFILEYKLSAVVPIIVVIVFILLLKVKQVRINPADEVVKEMRQLYDRGIRNFWFTDAQFIPARKFIERCRGIVRKDP